MMEMEQNRFFSVKGTIALAFLTGIVSVSLPFYSILSLIISLIIFWRALIDIAARKLFRFDPYITAWYLGIIPVNVIGSLGYAYRHFFGHRSDTVFESAIHANAIILLLGIVFFLFGYYSSTWHSLFARRGKTSRHLTAGQEFLVGMVLVSVIAAGIGYRLLSGTFAGITGYNAVMIQIQSASLASKIMYYLPPLLLPVTIGFAVGLIMLSCSRLSLWLGWGILLLVMGFSLITGVRGYVITVFLSYLVGLAIRKNGLRGRQLLRVVLFGVLVMAIFLSLTIMRLQGYLDELRIHHVLESLIRSLDHSNVNLLVITKIPRDVDYLLGESLISPLFFWVPSQIAYWEPRTLGKQVALWQGFTQKSGVTSGVPLFAELYANFSYIGVALGSYLFGSVLRFVRSWALSRSDDLFCFTLYVSVTTRAPMIIRGDFYSAITPLLAGSIVLWVLFLTFRVIRSQGGV